MRTGDTLRATFALTGAPTATPTARLLRNGVYDSAVTPTVAAGDGTNQYLASAQIPGGYAAGDTVELSASASVGGSAQSSVVARTTVDAPVAVAGSVTVGALSSGATQAIATAVLSDVTDTLGADVVAIKAKTDALPAWPTNFATLAIDTSGHVSTSGGTGSFPATAPTGWITSASYATGSGWGTWTLPQTVRAIAQFLFGKRSGVPTAGQTGTVTYADNAAVAYGTVVVDASGNITTSGLTPPA